MNEKSMFALRLKAALTAAGYEPRPSVLEREFNLRYWGAPITFQAVRRWLRGDSIPSQDKLQVLARWLGIEPQVLRYGEQASQVRAPMQATRVVPVNGEEDEVLRIYRDLPEEQRQVLRQVILAFARANDLQPGDSQESS